MVAGLLLMLILYGGKLTVFVRTKTVNFPPYRISINKRPATMMLSIIAPTTQVVKALIAGARAGSYFMETLYGIATVKMQGMAERRGSHWLNLKIKPSTKTVNFPPYRISINKRPATMMLSIIAPTTPLINVQWQSGLFRHLLQLPLTYFERRKMGDIHSRFSSLDALRGYRSIYE
jgi:ABC-type bacteriocin/lantibiotic exporter with double-glycine peptidase domain